MKFKILQILQEFFVSIYYYFKKNIIIFSLYIFAIIVGASNMFNLFDVSLEKGWVVVSLVFTLTYTVIFHIAGWKNKYFKILGGERSAFLVIANIILLVVIIWISIISFNSKENNNWELIIGLTTISFFVYSLINWIIYHHFNNKSKFAKKEYKKLLFNDLAGDFRSSVYTSDLPITLAFMFLLLYSCFLKNIIGFSVPLEQINDTTIKFDYFFSGAIAFQIMYSNAIWIFNDDKFFKPLPKLIEEYKEKLK